MLLKSVIIFATISAVYCTEVDKCGDLDNLPINVQLDDCVVQPCILKSGEPFEANITFDAPYDIYKLETVIYVSLTPLPTFPYPHEKDTCKSLVRGWCPLEKEERAVYNFQMQLPKLTAPLSIKIRPTITVVDNNEKKQIVCFNIKVRVTP